jgi:hypothetical protein
MGRQTGDRIGDKQQTNYARICYGMGRQTGDRIGDKQQANYRPEFVMEWEDKQERE